MTCLGICDGRRTIGEKRRGGYLRVRGNRPRMETPRRLGLAAFYRGNPDLTVDTTRHGVIVGRIQLRRNQMTRIIETFGQVDAAVIISSVLAMIAVGVFAVAMVML